MDGEPLGRGTELRIYLKEECQEYLDDAKLQDLIAKYSEFINFPIYLWVGGGGERASDGVGHTNVWCMNTANHVLHDTIPMHIHKHPLLPHAPIPQTSSEVERDEVPSTDDESIDDESTDETTEGDDVEDEDGEEEEDASAEETPKVKETVWDWKLLNENKAIWLRPAGEITEEEYTNFYKAVGKVCVCFDKECVCMEGFGEASIKRICVAVCVLCD